MTKISNIGTKKEVQILGIENYFGFGAWNLGFNRA